MAHGVRPGGGGWKKIARMEKNCVPPHTLRGLPAQKKLSRHNCTISIIFYPGPIPGAEMEFFAPKFPLHMACTELFEHIDHFQFLLLVEVIFEVAFFCFLLLGTNVGTRIEFFGSD